MFHVAEISANLRVTCDVSLTFGSMLIMYFVVAFSLTLNYLEMFLDGNLFVATGTVSVSHTHVISEWFYEYERYGQHFRPQ